MQKTALKYAAITPLTKVTPMENITGCEANKRAPAPIMVVNIEKVAAIITESRSFRDSALEIKTP